MLSQHEYSISEMNQLNLTTNMAFLINSKGAIEPFCSILNEYIFKYVGIIYYINFIFGSVINGDT